MITPVGEIRINFGWRGPTSWRGKGAHLISSIQIIDLILKNAANLISVQIPPNIQFSAKVHKFPFICRRAPVEESEIKSCKLEDSEQSSSSSLKVRIKEIHNLRIKAGIFNQLSAQYRALLGLGEYNQHECRYDRIIKFALPTDGLKANHTYTLLVTSTKDLSLSACLIEDKNTVMTKPDIQEDNYQFFQDQVELSQLLSDALLPLMQSKVMEFEMRAESVYPIRTVSDPNQQSAKRAIRRVVEKIEEDVLQELMIQVRTLQGEGKDKSLLEQNALEKEILRVCFDALDFKILADMMYGNLIRIIGDRHHHQFPPELQTLMRSVAVGFQRIYSRSFMSSTPSPL